MAKSNYFFKSGEPIEIGEHGQTSYVFHSGTPVPNAGTSGYVFESGFTFGTQIATGDYGILITGTNSPVGESGTLLVDVEVTNNDSSEQSGTITLTVGGVLRDAVDITLPGSTTSTITLGWETEDGDAGDYTALVESGTDSDSTSVTIEDVVDPESKTLVLTQANTSVTLPFTLRDDEGGDVRATVVSGLTDIRFVRCEFSFTQDAPYLQDNAGIGLGIGSSPSVLPSSITDFAMSLSFQEGGSRTFAATYDNGFAESGDLIFGVDDGTGTLDVAD